MAKRKKPVKRRKVRSDCGISRSTWREIPHEEFFSQANEPAPPDPMLVAYIDEIHNAALSPGSCRVQSPAKIRLGFGRRWKKWKTE
jgi:hypothetical protein